MTATNSRFKSPTKKILFLPLVDPDTLCPYCDEPFPKNPSPVLRRLLRDVKGSRPDPRPCNSKGRSAPILNYLNVCERHMFEVKELPKAEKAGWPTSIDFEALPARIAAMKPRLTKLLSERKDSLIWKEIKEELDSSSARKMTSLGGQYGNFHRCQTG